MTHCATCMTPEAVHDEMWCEISRLAGRPIYTLKDLYSNEIENILRKWFEWKRNLIDNTMRVTDYG